MNALNQVSNDFTGDLLDKLKKDPGMVKFKKKLIKILKANPTMKKIHFVDNVELGGIWKDGNKLNLTMNSLT